MKNFVFLAAASLLITPGATASNAEQPTDQLKILSGADQSAPQHDGLASFKPISIQLLDKDGHPRAGEAILFTCESPAGCGFRGNFLDYEKTDATGSATSLGFTTGFVGQFKVRVAGGYAFPVGVSETATALTTRKAVSDDRQNAKARASARPQ